jgi:uncharacterized protein (TIGR03118 family)
MANDAGLSDADNPTAYVRTDLVSNTQNLAQPLYPNLQNAWGVANAPGGPLWVSDNNDGLSTLYDGNGVRTNLTITVPLPAGKSAPPTATPTGMVWNPTSAFTITVGSTTVPATFIFDTEDGTISAWNATVDSVRANGLSTATLIVDHSASGGLQRPCLRHQHARQFPVRDQFRSGRRDGLRTHLRQNRNG